VDNFRLYADGGVITRNPSDEGGAWAWRLVSDADEIVLQGSGVILPAEAGLPQITNNLTELLACVEALEAMPGSWRGTLFTDSLVTLCRLFNADPSFNGVPPELEARTWAQRRRLWGYRVVLLDGHPTRKQLASGIGKRGNPCSKWNVACDEECRRLAVAFKTAKTAEANRASIVPDGSGEPTTVASGPG
jgi:hypothetical protein